jgi:hypothetical protein
MNSCVGSESSASPGSIARLEHNRHPNDEARSTGSHGKLWVPMVSLEVSDSATGERTNERYGHAAGSMALRQGATTTLGQSWKDLFLQRERLAISRQVVNGRP